MNHKRKQTSYYRGYSTYYDYETEKWYYEDNDKYIKSEDRPCARCGKTPTLSGADYCLKDLEVCDFINAACCGHGERIGYISLQDGRIFREIDSSDILFKMSRLEDENKKLKEENERLRKYNGQLKARLEKINGGYGHLTHRNGLTANEWLIESQERELQKKNEQISDWIERHNKDIEKISEQQNTISQLEEENEQLRQMIKENVFGRYEEGSLVDLEFKAIAYDDIIKLEIPNESEPKLIVTCKPGKVENVKSFCQMFIPFEMYYEIKELEDE